MISLSVSLLWLLAMLGAASHLRDSDRTMRSVAAVGAAFVVTMPLAYWLSPQPNWIAVLVGIAAVWRLISGPSPRIGTALAGVSAALGATLAMAGGVPAWQAAVLTAVALAAAFVLRGARGTAGGRHELLLVVVALATPVVGLAGDLVFGWHSATMLSQGAELKFEPLPGWTIGIVGTALLAGLVRGLWIRR